MFINKSELIYRKIKLSSEKGQVSSQLVAPKKYRIAVLKLAHETLMAGHFSTKKTSSRILAEFLVARILHNQLGILATKL